MRLIGILFVVTLLFALSVGAEAQDAKSAGVIEKQLAAIGAKDKRDAVKNMLAAGVSEFESKLPNTKGVGKGIVVTNPNNFFFLISLNSKEYPFEKIGYFDSKMSLPFVNAGARSPLGAFIADHEKILSDGVLGGTMSGRWLLLPGQVKRGKIVYGGTRKLGDRKVHALEYYPGDGASTEFTTRIFIDAENYQHVRTEYRHQISPRQDRWGTLGTQGGVILTLSEDFSDFRQTDGLTLPYKYQANYSSDSNSGMYEYKWRFNISQYQFNKNLAPDFFTFDVK